jgi:hypothetical protein
MRSYVQEGCFENTPYLYIQCGVNTHRLWDIIFTYLLLSHEYVCGECIMWRNQHPDVIVQLVNYGKNTPRVTLAKKYDHHKWRDGNKFRWN